MEQIRLQKIQLDQQAQRLKKDLFDRRFEVFTAVDSFITYVIRSDGKLKLSGPANTASGWTLCSEPKVVWGRSASVPSNGEKDSHRLAAGRAKA